MRPDVLKVDASEGGGDGLDGLDELLGVFLVDLDVEHIDAGIYLEQQSLTLHHGLAGEGAYIAESEHRGTVRNHGHEVALGGIVVGCLRVFLDFETRLGYAG